MSEAEWSVSNYDNILYHCVKSVRIRSYSGPYFPGFGLNTEIVRTSPYSVRMRENTDQNTPCTDTFHDVYLAAAALSMIDKSKSGSRKRSENEISLSHT